ncbi:MAG: T9SS type A sorting domain-containing protein, partial [Bacteroidales bacterium]|nr:T9SS type A sorting domain-containing protein [Bacteroidales bacterium]
PGPGPKSPTPAFLALKQQYENLMADFNRNGYADILSTAIPPQSGGTPNVNQETIEAAQYASQQINSIAAELFAQSHERVRALMADTLEDLQAVMAWLDATPDLASRYLEAETEFKLGGNNISLADIANHIATPEERDEYDNYLAFNGLKEALRYGNGQVAWTDATDAQIGELIRIADANTGRSSLLAKNVLCFFFGICYDDMEMRALETTTIPPTAESPTLTGQQIITVHPNPTNDVLHVTVTDGEIACVEMFDMFGRPVPVETHGRASLPSPQTTVTTSNIPSGLYILRVTLTDGTVQNMKVVKR